MRLRRRLPLAFPRGSCERASDGGTSMRGPLAVAVSCMLALAAQPTPSHASGAVPLAPATNLSVSVEQGSVVAHWTPPTWDANAFLEEITVKIANSDGGLVTQCFLPYEDKPSATSCEVDAYSPLSAGIEYRLVVEAKQSLNGPPYEEVSTAVHSFTIPNPLIPPTVTSITRSGDQVEIQWEPVSWPEGWTGGIEVTVPNRYSPSTPETVCWGWVPGTQCSVSVDKFGVGVRTPVSVTAKATLDRLRNGVSRPHVNASATTQIEFTRAPLIATPPNPPDPPVAVPKLEEPRPPRMGDLRPRRKSPNGLPVTIGSELTGLEDVEVVRTSLKAEGSSTARSRKQLKLGPGRYTITRSVAYRLVTQKEVPSTVATRTIFVDKKTASCDLVSWTTDDVYRDPTWGDYTYTLSCVIPQVSRVPVTAYLSDFSWPLSEMGTGVELRIPSQPVVVAKGTAGRIMEKRAKDKVSIVEVNPPCVWSKEAHRLRRGMSYSQVVGIIGGRGTVQIRGGVTVRAFEGCWGRNGGPNLYLGFVGGSLQSIVYDR